MQLLGSSKLEGESGEIRLVSTGTDASVDGVSSGIHLETVATSSGKNDIVALAGTVRDENAQMVSGSIVLESGSHTGEGEGGRMALHGGGGGSAGGGVEIRGGASQQAATSSSKQGHAGSVTLEAGSSVASRGGETVISGGAGGTKGGRVRMLSGDSKEGGSGGISIASATNDASSGKVTIGTGSGTLSGVGPNRCQSSQPVLRHNWSGKVGCSDAGACLRLRLFGTTGLDASHRNGA